jgi:hypothetical protein
MYIHKNFQLFLILFILVLFTGCIKKLDSDGLTLKIQESELNNFSEDFPIKKDFVFANTQIQKPNFFIKKGTNRLSATIDMSLSAIFIPSANGTFTLSGTPYFDKEKSGVFLKDVQIEKFEFNNIDLNKEFTKILTSNMKPVIDNVFTNFPIYELEKSSFKGSFVKDVKIEDSELLVLFGI